MDQRTSKRSLECHHADDIAGMFDEDDKDWGRSWSLAGALRMINFPLLLTFCELHHIIKDRTRMMSSEPRAGKL